MATKMGFSHYCPKHGRAPGWLEGYNPQADREITQSIEGSEIIIRARYRWCKCEFEKRGVLSGNVSKQGYVYMNTPKGYKPQHRVVWEQAYGEIPNGMVVHHINGIRCDNRLENLIALPKAHHNNAIPNPFDVTCPHCSRQFKIIKQSRKKPIVLPQEDIEYARTLKR